MINLIAQLSLFARSGFVSGSMSLFTPTNQIDSSCNIRREFDFLGAIFYLDPAARGSMSYTEKYIENQNIQANSRKKSWMKNLISAAHITSSSCLDKCNRFVSNFIPSRSTKCIFIMTWTPNPAVQLDAPASAHLFRIDFVAMIDGPAPIPCAHPELPWCWEPLPLGHKRETLFFVCAREKGAVSRLCPSAFLYNFRRRFF